MRFSSRFAPLCALMVGLAAPAHAQAQTQADPAQNLLPNLDNPKLRFGTGLVENGQPQISPLLPAVPGTPSPWYLAQWRQSAVMNGTTTGGGGAPDQYLGAPAYAYEAPDHHAYLRVYTDKPTGHLVYEIGEQGGAGNLGGGADLFLATKLTGDAANFGHKLQLSLHMRLTKADISYDSMTALKSNTVRSRGEVGLAIGFPSPLDGAPGILFMQLTLFSSRGSAVPLISCHLDNGQMQVQFSPAQPTLPLTFAASTAPLQRVSYDLNTYLQQLMAQNLDCQRPDGSQQSVSLARLDPAKVVVRSVHIGLDTQDTSKRKGSAHFGEKQGDVAAALQISAPRLTAGS